MGNVERHAHAAHSVGRTQPGEAAAEAEKRRERRHRGVAQPDSHRDVEPRFFHNGHYNNILFGVHSPEGSGWFIPGKNDALYLHKNGGAAKDTRVLRFRKSEVEYVY